MGFGQFVGEIRGLVEKLAKSPYREAEYASSVAMAHSTHGDMNRPDFHAKGIAAHSKAMHKLGGALNQARQSNDIEAEKHLKGMYVRHQDAREAHRFGTPDKTTPTEDVDPECREFFTRLRKR